MWWKTCATLGPIGYLPASGTIASACAMPLAYVLYTYGIAPYTGLILGIVFCGALYSAWRTAVYFQQHDPSYIVIDELMGILITFIGVPLHARTMLVGFMLFRFFDITKCAGVAAWQQLPAPWGIVIDDIIAALISNIILHMFWW